MKPTASMTPKRFVEEVDKLLYTAKENGRDRIESARL
jgi:PleD family two-component response regulator